MEEKLTKLYFCFKSPKQCLGLFNYFISFSNHFIALIIIFSFSFGNKKY